MSDPEAVSAPAVSAPERARSSSVTVARCSTASRTLPWDQDVYAGTTAPVASITSSNRKLWVLPHACSMTFTDECALSVVSGAVKRTQHSIHLLQLGVVS